MAMKLCDEHANLLVDRAHWEMVVMKNCLAVYLIHTVEEKVYFNITCNEMVAFVV